MALIGYLRTSDGRDFVQQQSALTVAGCEQLLVDRCATIDADRPALFQALSSAERGDTIVVWKLDRLARSLPDLIEIVRTLGANGVGLRSLKDSFDLDTTGTMLHALRVIAEFQRDVARARRVASRADVPAKTRHRGPVASISPDKLARARLLIAAGYTVREAASRIKVGRSALDRVLQASTETGATTE